MKWTGRVNAALRRARALVAGTADRCTVCQAPIGAHLPPTRIVDPEAHCAFCGSLFSTDLLERGTHRRVIGRQARALLEARFGPFPRDVEAMPTHSITVPMIRAALRAAGDAEHGDEEHGDPWGVVVS